MPRALSRTFRVSLPEDCTFSLLDTRRCLPHLIEVWDRAVRSILISRMSHGHQKHAVCARKGTQKLLTLPAHPPTLLPSVNPRVTVWCFHVYH